MTSPAPIRLGGVAAMLGGTMWVLKGGAIMLGFPDPNLFVPAQLFFALGLLGLHAWLKGRDGWLVRIGGFLAYAAVALSVVNAPYSLFFEEDAVQPPFPFNVTYGVAALSIFVGLVLLGIATLRAENLPPRWRALPLVIGLSALLPVWVLAFIHLEVPVVVIGAAWMLLGYILCSERGGWRGSLHTR
jgi:hypothetical protein